jgi:predicted nuclease of predicted toxin-antitoxin system
MIWVDAHLSPALARWITAEFGHPAQPVRDLGLREAKDRKIFDAARREETIILTKDADFVELVERLGPPPRIIWLTCGNTSEAVLRVLLRAALPRALELFTSGESLVEIGGEQPLPPPALPADN